MSLRAYLPSAQFSLIVGSIALSALLVVGAQAYIARTNAPSSIQTSTDDTSSTNTQWQQALADIQASSGVTAPSAPSSQLVSQLLAAAKTNNITATIGRTLLVNLSNAKSQGLGDDIPTQNQIVAAATSQLKSQQATSTTYTYADLTIIPTSNSALHSYGNDVMRVLSATSTASERATLLSIDYAVEGGSQTQGPVLASIGDSYKAMALGLLAIPVPQTLAPLHLQMVNTLLSTSATYADMETIGSDPVRGLAGLQNYESLLDQGARVFTSIAQELSKDGILFTKDEPGNAWNVFFSTSS